MADKVLVTGAAGYVGTHVVQQLLQAGYQVRASVKTFSDDAEVQYLREVCPDKNTKLEIVEGDVLTADIWIDIVRGCSHVIHAASPFQIPSPKNAVEVIKPAVEGTLNILKACRASRTVRRFVLVSSSVAIGGDFNFKGEKTYTTDDWADPHSKNCSAYVRSKILQERSAWGYVKDLRDSERFELVSVNPVFILGPPICKELGTSQAFIKRLMEGKMPFVLDMTFGVVDVRDVASVLIAAMNAPEAAGRRIIARNGSNGFKDVSRALRGEFHSQGYDIPALVSPLWLAKGLSILDPTLREIISWYGKVATYEDDSLQKILKFKTEDFHDLADTVTDMVYAMIEQGRIKRTKKYRPRTRMSGGTHQ